LTPVLPRALLNAPVNLPASEREQLVALLAAVEDPPRAAALAADDPLVVKVARHHRLSPLLSATCSEWLPSPLAETFRRDRLVTAARNMILGQVAEACLGALGEAGIRTIVLKGLDYETRLYRLAGVRPTADVDLLVPGDKRREAFAVLDRLGFEPRAAAPGFDDPDYHEVAWTRRGVEVDLHLALAPLARCRIDYAAVWAEARPLRLGQSDGWSLAPSHAAIFHALHMAIDHFDVPAIYLADLARLLPDADDLRAADRIAEGWHCRAPLATASTLAAAFLPRWATRQAIPAAAMVAARIVGRYGSSSPVRRPEQLFRKLAHFDALSDAIRYVAVQSRRNLEEQIERRIRRRSPRERLSLSVHASEPLVRSTAQPEAAPQPEAGPQPEGAP
jgi:hypothetical protein